MDRMDHPTGPRLSAHWRAGYRRKARTVVPVAVALSAALWAVIVWAAVCAVSVPAATRWLP
jgi:hypothetical protein